MTDKLTPVGYDYGGNPEYDVPPIEVKEGAPNPGVAPPYWLEYITWVCPNCGSELDFSPTHDRSIDGLALMAVPDQWRCVDCRYTWTE